MLQEHKWLSPITEINHFFAIIYHCIAFSGSYAVSYDKNTLIDGFNT
jgi:hypothetical protein